MQISEVIEKLNINKLIVCNVEKKYSAPYYIKKHTIKHNVICGFIEYTHNKTLMNFFIQNEDKKTFQTYSNIDSFILNLNQKTK
jgi:hypothetical protein